MNRAFGATIVLLCTFLGSAQADYILTPLSGGASSATVEWGDSFMLDLVLSSNGDDLHNSAIFDLVFTQPNLRYDAYHWAPPYGDAPPNDDSTPLLADLPAMITADTLSGTGHPAGVVDVELSNVLIGHTFGTGTLVTLSLTVPADYGFNGSLYIAAVPDTFANGFEIIPTTAGQVFELHVIPEPASMILFALSGLLAARLRVMSVMRSNR